MVFLLIPKSNYRLSEPTKSTKISREGDYTENPTIHNAQKNTIDPSNGLSISTTLDTNEQVPK